MALVIPLLEDSILISDLSLDGELFIARYLGCLQRGAQVTHLVFGVPPLTNGTFGDYFPPPLINADGVFRDSFDLKILSIGSVTTTLLPRLESLEAHHLSSLTDEDLDMITRLIFVLSAFSVLNAKRVAEKKSQGCRPQSIATQELVIHLPYDLSVRKHCFVAKHTSWIWFLAYLIARFIKKSFYSLSTCPCLHDFFFFFCYPPAI